MAIATKPDIIENAIKRAADKKEFNRRHQEQQTMITEIILMISEEEASEETAKQSADNQISGNIAVSHDDSDNEHTALSNTMPALRPTVLLEAAQEPKIAQNPMLKRQASLTLPGQSWDFGTISANQLVKKINQGATSLLGAVNQVASTGYAAITEEHAAQLLESPIQLQQVAKLQLKPEHRANIEAHKRAESRLRKALRTLLSPKPSAESLQEAAVIIIARYGFVRAAKKAITSALRMTTNKKKCSPLVASLSIDLEQQTDVRKTLICQ